jgi:Fe-S cluster assembly ATP-binding protein
VFDEPEAGIDLWSFHNLIKVFEELQKAHNGSLIIISHQERILNIADKIVVVAEGKIQSQGTKEEILPGLLSDTQSCLYYQEAPGALPPAGRRENYHG